MARFIGQLIYGIINLCRNYPILLIFIIALIIVIIIRKKSKKKTRLIQILLKKIKTSIFQYIF